MKTLVCVVKVQNVDINTLSGSHAVLLLDDDKKGFTVIKHRGMPVKNEHKHMSELKNVILVD